MNCPKCNHDFELSTKEMYESVLVDADYFECPKCKTKIDIYTDEDTEGNLGYHVYVFSESKI